MKILCTLEEYTRLVENCLSTRVFDDCENCIHCCDCNKDEGIKDFCEVVPDEARKDG